MLKNVDWNLLRFLTGSVITESAGRPSPDSWYCPPRKWARPKIVAFKASVPKKTRTRH
ncbi:hypothetical protein PM3016_4830 [Paenibacillus mucilaginosus 3016]|uniref:Uncharacterized protein n=1 Tax=Paenibacillus mucilaginosus 3016 TaxID=1116391 RepID=H6NK82_9BACL|nr:hypothetical protein PM3016_4830 [Paenibacillus mucilaginosus 3016]